MTEAIEYENLPASVLPLRGTVKASFAYVTIKDRMPVILCRAIDSLSKSFDYCKESPPGPIIARLSKLKYEMERDKPYEGFEGPHAEHWNGRLQELRRDGVGTWFQGPWLFAECAMVSVL
jgi:hypothetical protein